ncbi:hypothetical protein C1C98_06265 [Pseudomonas ogarae]|uniref:Uncharacterized protein n=1 Tax=Pseudomonas ogarae (strain DSM 112162 / CECT 30235 / F113) TaxID=1114970 RepID=A0ABM6QUW7_PSEO1|nr:hypothetical protein C1C98_06265 [Pseudomonas ogarae]
MMKRIKGIREKMWAGQTAPFFCLRFLDPKKQKGPQGAFSTNAGVISVRGLRSCLPCHPTLQRQAAHLSSR